MSGSKNGRKAKKYDPKEVSFSFLISTFFKLSLVTPYLDNTVSKLSEISFCETNFSSFLLVILSSLPIIEISFTSPAPTWRASSEIAIFFGLFSKPTKVL